MAFKAALILASIAQLLAAILALRINLRYRIYSAWFFLSAAACVGAMLRLTTLSEVWNETPTFLNNGPLWLSAVASLLASILLLAGMALIEPFFIRLALAEQTLLKEHRQLESIVRETEGELELAQRIQRRLLPASPPELPEVDVYGESVAADWTSGDYFDYLALRSGATATMIADVSGHGLGPALLMSSIRASFRGLSRTLSDVGELLTYGNRAVVDSVSDSEFVTAFAVRYDAESRTLFYAGAGHVAYLLKHSGQSLLLEASAPPLGILPELAVETCQQADIEVGDVLILVTDGILESRNASGEMFGEQRLLDSVAESRTQPARSIVRNLLHTSHAFSQGKPQQDDITAVILKFV
ncbi:MAG: serine/threonine-protein phosphatase [Planctomycetales bacterium]|nr:serine/threonine-protein phosphatase [Planctomycetales bacterium]